MPLSVDVFHQIAARLTLTEAAWEQPLGQGDWPQAAVLVAVTEEPEPLVLLGRRAMHLSLHPGEIAFAGGKRELPDVSPWETAMREAMEEVGIPAEAVTPLGEMKPLITRTGFEVFPCVAKIPTGLELVVDPGEFDSVFMAPLSIFADTNIFRLETMTKGGTSLKVPHYQVKNDNIWGVTAAILVQLVNVAYDAGLDLQRNWKLEP